MPTRRGRAAFEADVGREPAPDAEDASLEDGEPSGDTEGYGDEHGEDRDRSGQRPGQITDGGQTG